MIPFSPQAFGPVDSSETTASIISTPHIKVSVRKRGLQCHSGDMLTGIPLADGQIEVGSELSEDLGGISSQEPS